MNGTGLEQHGHAAGVANNSPVGCCLVRGFQRLGMSTKKAPPAGAPFAPPRLGGTGQEQCKSKPFVKNKGRVSSWRWYPAFFASGMVFRLAVWYTRLNKSEFIVLPLKNLVISGVSAYQILKPSCTFPVFPLRAATRERFSLPLTTLSSSRAELRFASLVEWA